MLVLLLVLTAINLLAWFKYRKIIKNRNYSSKLMKYWAGIAMVILHGYAGKLIKNSNVIKKKLSKIKVKDNPDYEESIYIEEKLIITLALFYMTIFIALISVLVSDNSGRISSLKRNDTGQGEAYYSLSVDKDGEEGEKDIDLTVPEKKQTENQALEEIEEYSEELEKIMLSDNKSLDQIDKDLDFPSTSTDGRIQIVWDVISPDIVAYDGSIGENLPDTGTETSVYARLMIGKVSKEYKFDITVYPKDYSDDLQGYVQNYINGEDENTDEVSLPDTLGKENLEYTLAGDDTHIYILVLGILAAVAYFIFRDMELKKEIDKRNEQLKEDYTEVVSQMLILITAGIAVKKAFYFIYKNGGKKKEHYLYKEIRLMLAKIESGISEQTAYGEFAKRCELHSYIRFINIILKGINKGNVGLSKELEMELDMAFSEKKNSALKKGELAGTKLLIPMIMMLVVSMMIIAAPAFMSMS